MSPQHVYFFGDGSAEGGAELRELLGGKGANFGEVTRLGVPVPRGFTLTTEVCRCYMGRGYPDGLRTEVGAALQRLERVTGKQFGGSALPLLVSVRSGAAVSVPGMMDTILNLGLNDHTVAALGEAAGDHAFAMDSYRRFVQMYGNVVLGVRGERFEHALEARKHSRGVRDDTALEAGDLAGLVVEYKALVQAETGVPFPQDPQAQLWGAIDGSSVAGTPHGRRHIAD